MKRRTFPGILPALVALLPASGAALVLTSAVPARAATEGEAAAAGAVVGARVDLKGGLLRLRRCATSPCRATDQDNGPPIEIPAEGRPSEGDVVVEALTVGPGKVLLHVRVPGRSPGSGAVTTPRGRAWEALLVPGRDAPLFVGATGLVKGDEGERTGQGLEVTAPSRPGTFARVLLGELREDVTLCGQDVTLVAPRAYDPASGTWGPPNPLGPTAAQAAKARALSGAPSPPTGSPLVPLLGSGAVGSLGSALLRRAPPEVPLARLTITRGAPTLSAVFVLTDRETFAVSAPPASLSFDVTLPSPVRTSCVAVTPRAGAGALVDVVAYSALEGPGVTLATVVRHLEDEGPDGEGASALLKRGGPAVGRAVEAAWPQLGPVGRGRAVDVLSSVVPCAEAAPLWIRSLSEARAPSPSPRSSRGPAPVDEARRRAQAHLERCGHGALPALSSAVTGASLEGRAVAAPLLAQIGGASALPVLAGVAGEGPAEIRSVVRGALAKAARTASPEALATLLAPGLPPRAALERLRGLREVLPRVPREAHDTLEGILRAQPSADERWLALDLLAVLARAGDPWAQGILEASTRDTDGPVRVRALEVGGDLAGVARRLGSLADDPEPRVRRAALMELERHPQADGAEVAIRHLHDEPWTFVRVAAVGALGAAPSSARSAKAVPDALAVSLRDGAPAVRVATLAIIGRRREASLGSEVLRRLVDNDEEMDVRAAAAETLGTLCVGAAVEPLTTLARHSPGTDGEGAAVSAAAVAALGHLRPADLAQRLEPLRGAGAPPLLVRAVESALRDPAPCRW